MRRTLAVLALAVLTVTAGCSGAGPLNANSDAPTTTDSSSTDADQTIQVAASGQVQTEPDRAVIRLEVTSRADSVETVRRELAENASKLQTALEDAGLDADQITTTRYDIGRNHRHEKRSSEPEFQGRHAFTVTVDEIDRAGEIVVTAVENGASRVRDVQFTITRETRQELRKQALADAIENARGKAAVSANGTELELDGVRTVQTGDVSTRSPRRTNVEFATASADSGGTSTSLESGSVTITAEVVVIYNASSD